MAQLIESYTLDGERHRIELVPAEGGGRLLLDRGGCAAPRVIAELGPDEGDGWVDGLLYGEGAYLERALGGERGLAVRLPEPQAPPAHLPRMVAAFGASAPAERRAA